MKMKQDIKERWVAALRSGGYKQGMGALNDGQGNFCCLGVLCDLAIKEGIQMEVTLDASGVTDVLHYDGYSGTLPPAVQHWANLPNRPSVREGSLAALNDSGMSFAEIADLIEEGL